jgi:hypothetical protein
MEIFLHQSIASSLIILFIIVVKVVCLLISQGYLRHLVVAVMLRISSPDWADGNAGSCT